MKHCPTFIIDNSFSKMIISVVFVKYDKNDDFSLRGTCNFAVNLNRGGEESSPQRGL